MSDHQAEGCESQESKLVDEELKILLDNFNLKRKKFIGSYCQFLKSKSDDDSNPLMFNLLSEEDFEKKYSTSWDVLWYARTNLKERPPHHKPPNPRHPGVYRPDMYDDRIDGTLWEEPTSHLNNQGLTEIYSLGDIRTAEDPALRQAQPMDAMAIEKQLLATGQTGHTPNFPHIHHQSHRDKESQQIKNVLRIGVNGSGGSSEEGVYRPDASENVQQMKQQEYQQYYNKGIPDQYMQQQRYNMGVQPNMGMDPMAAHRGQQQYGSNQPAYYNQKAAQQAAAMEYYTYQQQLMRQQQQQQMQMQSPQFRRLWMQQQYLHQQQQQAQMKGMNPEMQEHNGEYANPSEGLKALRQHQQRVIQQQMKGGTPMQQQQQQQQQYIGMQYQQYQQQHAKGSPMQQQQYHQQFGATPKGSNNNAER